jgi:O-antigen/teichoic acid export membrane protein
MHSSFKKAALSRLPDGLQIRIDSLANSPIALRFARGAFWSTLASTATGLLSVASSIVLARLLGKEEFGGYGIIQSTLTMFQLFAGFGVGLTATKFVAQYRKNDPQRAARIIGLSSAVAVTAGSLIAGLVYLSSSWLAIHTLGAPQLTRMLQVSSLVLLFNAVNGAQTGALAGLESFRTIAKLNLGLGLISLTLTAGGAYLGGLKGAVVGLAITATANCLIARFALKKQLQGAGIPGVAKDWVKEVRVLWRFSVPAIFASSMVGPVNWACSAMLVHRIGGLAQMGIYSAANQWYLVMIFLPVVLEQVTLPMISERLGANDGIWTQKLLIFSVKASTSAALPLLVFGGFASPWIMRLYGNGFREAWPTLVIVLLTGCVFAIQAPVGQLVAGKGQMWLGFLMNAGWGAAMLGFTTLFIHKGAFGLALARLCAYVLHSVWTFAYARHFVRSLVLDQKSADSACQVGTA